MGNDRHTYCSFSQALRSGALALSLLGLGFHPLFAQEQLLPVLHFETLEGFRPEWVTAQVVRDSFGYVWIGTLNGLRRYDGYDYKEYRNIPDDPSSLSSSRIHSLLVDRKQRLWVGTTEKGLSLYDRSHDRFINFYPYPDDSSSGSRVVHRMTEDHSGNIWLATLGGVISVCLPENSDSYGEDSLARKLCFRRIPLQTPRGEGRDIVERSDGKIIVGSDSGLFILDPSTLTLARPRFNNALASRLQSLLIRCLTLSSDGALWLGTATEGVYYLDLNSGNAKNYRHREGDRYSIGSDDIWDLRVERNGNLWIGTVEGVDLLSASTGRCIPYLTVGPRPEGSILMRLAYDSTGTLWVSTNPNVYRLTPESQRFLHYSLPKKDGSVSRFETIERAPDGKLWCFSEGNVLQIDFTTLSVVRAIDVFKGRRPLRYSTRRTSSFIDRKGYYWYAAMDLGLYRVNLATGQIRHYSYKTRLSKTTMLRNIAAGNGDTLWIGGQVEGVMKFDPVSGAFLPLLLRNIGNIMNDHQGRLWVGTEAEGVYIFDLVKGVTDRLFHVPSDTRSLSHNLVWDVYEDPSRRIWVGAGNVINLWDSVSRSFSRYINPGFPDAASAHPIGSDSKRRLWVAYGKGLSILDPSTGQYRNFSTSDGLCRGISDMEILNDGNVLLSGATGVNIVYPENVERQRLLPSLVISKMSINDQPVVPPMNPVAFGSLELSYRQDVVEFGFAAIDLIRPHLVRYEYKLDGLEKDWVRPENRRFVRYTALPPGEFVFRVRASSEWSEWPDQELRLAINISHPWWRTTWAYAAYAILAVGLFFAAYRVRLRQLHLQQEVELGQYKAEHLAEVDRLKSRFFANISHEFRTPLTLILGPIQKWRDRTQEGDEKKELGMAERNAQRLLRLINQLLDLSKLEEGAIKLRANRMNIVPLVRGIAYSFESSAGMRGIALNVSVEEEEIEVYCDRDMVEKILSNLLSNAFKFTPEGGEVEVSIRTCKDVHSDVPPQGDRLEIAVFDTGIGIPPDQLDKVFDRFYQVDASQTREHEGSGIGLALVKELVELHHGTIRVQSEVGKGTTFTVRLPLGRSHLKNDEIVGAPVSVEPRVREAEGAVIDKAVEGAKEEVVPEHARGEKPIVLIVEDNSDVRAYIRDYLVSAYQVTEAGDGAEGIEKAQEVIPDLIITDVMMPKKDGYEVCRTLKLDEKTCHIPIILLTAKAASENKIEGLEIGADDYLIKPFEPKELLARVRNLISLRRKLRERFKASVPLKPGEIDITSMDNAFLKKVMAAVEQHMGDERFHIEELGALVGMSRRQLHRKLAALTNQGPGEFIRSFRLHRAMDLLQKGAGTVSEVAYRVGFSDPSYFSKCFQQQFGTAPSDVRKSSA